MINLMEMALECYCKHCKKYYPNSAKHLVKSSQMYNKLEREKYNRIYI